ncbi:hypothetical protein [Odoribacter laneus]|jgi:hypothetical protein|uniref:DUF4179 domain-containing protein n=1 Tax=Odoribacter laneus YIT 12061 TaxID=742817 RepID=H1DG45_9BACT|nr:hypothetical protein [Odoribacter laneus]EHP48157.1 hypothetical protein HMPREF9449_01231 [Odoribacter laneus YIT 12061]MBS1446364.1 hypothetical protein [Odoribacter sp.]
MSNLLNEKIKNQAEIFDTALPPFGHFERFEERLERHEQRKNRHARRWIIVTSAAATLALILMFQYFYPIRIPSATTDSIKEVTTYYNRQLQQQINDIEQNINLVNEPERDEILKDITDMENESQKLDKKVPGITEEEYIAYIISRYNMQLESLEHIQTILKSLPNSKKQNL